MGPSPSKSHLQSDAFHFDTLPTAGVLQAGDNKERTGREAVANFRRELLSLSDPRTFRRQISPYTTTNSQQAPIKVKLISPPSVPKRCCAPDSFSFKTRPQDNPWGRAPPTFLELTGALDKLKLSFLRYGTNKKMALGDAVLNGKFIVAQFGKFVEHIQNSVKFWQLALSTGQQSSGRGVNPKNLRGVGLKFRGSRMHP
jgi:hypothetical protein